MSLFKKERPEPNWFGVEINSDYALKNAFIWFWHHGLGRFENKGLVLCEDGKMRMRMEYEIFRKDQRTERSLSFLDRALNRLGVSRNSS